MSVSRGFSLLELIIAMVLGLVLMGVLLEMYLASSRSSRFNNAVMRAQENGRFAVDIISRSARMAGYDDPSTATTVGTPYIHGAISDSGALISQSNLKADSDNVSFRFEGGAEIRDCQGQLVAADDWVTNMFAISGDANLVCATLTNNGGMVSDAQPLAEGVEDMRVHYGLDLNDDGTANRYVRANHVSDWSQVVSLQVSLLVNSVTNALDEDATVCKGCVNFTGSLDRVFRQEFQTTIQIRN